MNISQGTGASRSRSALILVGHGSHHSSDSSAPVYAHAERIRKAGIFDEVLEAFWKEEPSLGDALDLVDSDRVWIVPLFLAEGYFTRDVLPRELGLATPRPEVEVHYCPPIGTHPKMVQLVLQRARSICGLAGEQLRETALVVIGHGTDQSATSGDTLYDLLQGLRRAGEFQQVECGFLDEAPHVREVIASVTARDVVLVPFFAAEGWHTRTTIPEDLGLTGARTEQSGRTLWYTPPIGTLDEVTEIVLAIAADAGAPVARHLDPGPSIPASHEITRARGAFFEWIEEVHPAGRVFLDLRIHGSGDGRYQVHHLQDDAALAGSLQKHYDPEAARLLARFDDRGGYRPLKSAAGLQGGWRFDDLDQDQLWRILGLLYPAAVLHWFRSRVADTQPNSFRSWAARQSGIYAGLRQLDEATVQAVVERCCVGIGCQRTRRWSWEEEEGGRHESGGLALFRGGAVVGCPEPCTLFGTYAREALPGPDPNR